MELSARYGVRITNEAKDATAEAAETLRLLGYAVVDAGLTPAEMEGLREGFEALRRKAGVDDLAELRRRVGEQDLLRCPLAEEPRFLALAANPRILALCEALIGPGFILNQQNGIVNPAGAEHYSQSPFHRDLPYQHFVSTRPLALNALFCLDPFTEENGATWVIPASHKEEAFPSEPVLRAQRRQVSAPAGSFLVLDCMIWHGGGQNRANWDRRAVNHVYTIAMMRQQIDLPSHLGEGFTRDAALRRLLGFGHPQPRSVREYLEGQAARRGV